MARLETLIAGGRRLPALDVAVLTWTIAWIVIAVIVANEIQGLAELSDTVVTVGGAAVTSGEAIATLSDLVPIVGGALEGPAEEIREAGVLAQESGAENRGSVNTLSLLLGFSIAAMPSVPVLAAYLPGRLSRAAEARAVEQMRRTAGDDRLFVELLARRATQNLSYRQLAAVSSEPWRDIEQGRLDGLARAELRRLGLEPYTSPGRR